MANVYGGVKDAATGKPAPEGVPAMQPNGKKPANGGLGGAFKADVIRQDAENLVTLWMLREYNRLLVARASVDILYPIGMAIAERLGMTDKPEEAPRKSVQEILEETARTLSNPKRGVLPIPPDVEEKNRVMEKNNIKHKAGIDPEDTEEIWTGINYSLDHWAERDARKLVNGYLLYPAPGVPTGCVEPKVEAQVLYYVILWIQGSMDRIIMAAVGLHGELLFKAKRGVVRDYLVSTRKFVKPGGATLPPPFLSRTTPTAGSIPTPGFMTTVMVEGK